MPAALTKFMIGTHMRKGLTWDDIRKTINEGIPTLVGKNSVVLASGGRITTSDGKGERIDELRSADRGWKTVTARP